jgi:hypothetical protein
MLSLGDTPVVITVLTYIRHGPEQCCKVGETFSDSLASSYVDKNEEKSGELEREGNTGNLCAS